MSIVIKMLVRPGCPLLVLAVSCSIAACDDEDAVRLAAGGGGTAPTSADAGAGGGGAGSDGAGGDGAGGGQAGMGGSAGAGALVGNYCLLGTIAEYCSRQTCPSVSQAREQLRSFDASRFIERPCQGEQGAPRRLLHADQLYRSTTYLFDITGASLVGVVTQYFEAVSCGSRTARGSFYGEMGGDCSETRFGEPPPGCPAPDGGPTYECSLTDAGAGD